MEKHYNKTSTKQFKLDKFGSLAVTGEIRWAVSCNVLKLYVGHGQD